MSGAQTGTGQKKAFRAALAWVRLGQRRLTTSSVSYSRAFRRYVVAWSAYLGWFMRVSFDPQRYKTPSAFGGALLTDP
jgi:hypothetical protein